jgi:hypothetical protein
VVPATAAALNVRRPAMSARRATAIRNGRTAPMAGSEDQRIPTDEGEAISRASVAEPPTCYGRRPLLPDARANPVSAGLLAA